MYAIFLFMLCISSGQSLHIDYYSENYLESEDGMDLETQYEANPLPNSTVKSTVGEPNLKTQYEAVSLPNSTVDHIDHPDKGN